MSGSGVKRILFVCSGNICRSPLAHTLFENLVKERGLSALYEVESAGTTGYHVGDNADPRMRRTAAKHGVRIDHVARQLSRQDLAEYDMLLVMDRDNYRSVDRMLGNRDEGDRLRYFRDFDPAASSHPARSPEAEVPDPYYGGPEGFERVFQIVKRTSEGLLDHLERERAREGGATGSPQPSARNGGGRG